MSAALNSLEKERLGKLSPEYSHILVTCCQSS
jgi:hypothetical protein